MYISNTIKENSFCCLTYITHSIEIYWDVNELMFSLSRNMLYIVAYSLQCCIDRTSWPMLFAQQKVLKQSFICYIDLRFKEAKQILLCNRIIYTSPCVYAYIVLKMYSLQVMYCLKIYSVFTGDVIDLINTVNVLFFGILFVNARLLNKPDKGM